MKTADLSAVTLYRDFVAEALKTDNKGTAVREAWTELIQMIQGNSVKLPVLTSIPLIIILIY